MKLALLSGSLRIASYNTALLRALSAMFPEHVQCTLIDIDLPLYCADLDTPDRIPPKAKVLREAIEKADGVVVSTPEYNYAVPGTVKNALDWVSRPPGESKWKNKPVAIMGASPSFTGTARAQQMTKTCFLMVGATLFTGLEVLVAHADERFDKNGTLTDERTRVVLEKFAQLYPPFVEANSHD